MSFADRMKTIVVATDLQGTSEAALEYARKLAGAYGARIVLAHGADPLEYAAVDSVPGNVLRHISEQARSVLDNMVADLIREGIHSHSELRQGAVVDMLLEVASQYEAGLIVIGTKGSQGAGPVAVGAIVEQLVRRSTCPVLAVAADWNAGENRPIPGGPVMLAIDQNDAKQAAVEVASSLAATFRRTLIVVHARTSAEASAFLNPCATTLADFGIKESAEFPVRCIVKDGPPEDAIPRAVLQYGPSILVTGVKRKSDSPGPHGTVFTLLASSRAPVLCIPAPADTEKIQPDAELAANVG
ncbi:universal stress protein [Occallatibacter riparius]|uniref:Universal stress protein n=1 Tax=Occallatibacter riparius TaxID=1002689 RepID=A0A9J7BK53_9BACT|nr:universal stress protein [Occallatibacter riparius]UWZ81661.1 universal stress protein [Occallatibacter riparius]